MPNFHRRIYLYAIIIIVGARYHTLFEKETKYPRKSHVIDSMCLSRVTHIKGGTKKKHICLFGLMHKLLHSDTHLRPPILVYSLFDFPLYSCGARMRRKFVKRKAFLSARVLISLQNQYRTNDCGQKSMSIRLFRTIYQIRASGFV